MQISADVSADPELLWAAKCNLRISDLLFPAVKCTSLTAMLLYKEVEMFRVGKYSSASQSKQIAKETGLFSGVGKSTCISLNQADSSLWHSKGKGTPEPLGFRHPQCNKKNILPPWSSWAKESTEGSWIWAAHICYGHSKSLLLMLPFQTRNLFQVKAAEMWRLEPSASAGAGLGTGSSRSPTPAAAPTGKGSTALPSQHQK